MTGRVCAVAQDPSEKWAGQESSSRQTGQFRIRYPTGYDDTVIDQGIAKVGGCLIIDEKGVFDAIHRSESAALSMQDKRSAVEGLALRGGIGRTKTLLRWCHSEANVADALPKLDNRAHDLLRKFLQAKVWRIVGGPDFTSSKKLKQQKKGKQSRTS